MPMLVWMHRRTIIVLVVIALLAAAGLTINGVTTPHKDPALQQFMSCTKTAFRFRTATAAERSGLATILLTAHGGDVLATLIAYALPESSGSRQTARLLGSVAGIKFAFGNSRVRGRAAISFTADAPERGVPTSYAKILQSRVRSCLAR